MATGRRETVQYQVTYQVANVSALTHGTLELLAQHRVPLNDPAAMQRHLRRMLDARNPPIRNPLLNGHLNPAYQQLHHAAVDGMPIWSHPNRALRAWTFSQNLYTGRLNEALRNYVRTGHADNFDNDDYPDEDEPNYLFELNPLDEELYILAGLLRLPACRTDTLRISSADECSTVDPATGALAISGTMLPGHIVSNYPSPMTTTSSGSLEQFGGFPRRVSTAIEIRVSRFIGTSGRPLLELNEGLEAEEAVLFSARGVFQIVAVAYAEAEDVPTRIAAIYVEVQGVDPTRVPNIHTGELPRHFLHRDDPRILANVWRL